MQQQGGFPESDEDPFPTDPIHVPHTRSDQSEPPTADPTATTETLSAQYLPSERPRTSDESIEQTDTYHGNWTDWVYPDPVAEDAASNAPTPPSGTPAANYPLTEDTSRPDAGASGVDPPTDRLPRLAAPPATDLPAVSEPAEAHAAPVDRASATPDEAGRAQPSPELPGRGHAYLGGEQRSTRPNEVAAGQEAPTTNPSHHDDRAEPSLAARHGDAPHRTASPTDARAPEPQRPLPSPEGKAALDRLRQQRTAETTEPIQPRGGYRQSGQRRWVPPVLGTMGAAALFAAAYVQFGGNDSEPTQPAEPTAVDERVAPISSSLCPGERNGNSIQSNGAGGDASGTDAILAFQHAYYVARSAETARESVAPDAAVPPAADIQQGIDTIPIGTTHCLSITPGAFVGQYTVVITEHRPNGAPISYNPQLVTTEDLGGRTVITGIGPMP